MVAATKFLTLQFLKTVSLLGVLLLLFLSPTSSAAAAVDVEQAKELPCPQPFQPQVARNVDFRWMLGVDRWYIPLQSVLNKFRFAETLLEIKMEELTEDNLAQNASCFKFKWDVSHPKLYGEGETEVTFMVTPLYENSFGFKGLSSTAKRGRSYMTLRDNESFVFFTTCWEDEEASWHVISTTPTLPDSVAQEIIKHAISLGFKPSHFSTKDCRHSPNTQTNAINDKTEL